MLKPNGDYLLFSLVDIERTTPHGIIQPVSHNQDTIAGLVEAVGPDVDHKMIRPQQTIIHVAHAAKQAVNGPDNVYFVCRADSVLATEKVADVKIVEEADEKQERRIQLN